MLPTTRLSDRAVRSDGAALREQFLPFTVHLVRTEVELGHAVAVRAAAYLRHNAPAADKLKVAEPDDSRSDVVVLVARSKLDNGVLGTVRINPNFATPMKFESSVCLPPHLKTRRCAEMMRLGVANGESSRLVTQALAKATYQLCVAAGIEYVFVASRSPVNLVYKAFMFDDLLDGEMVELSYAPGALHSILSIPIGEAEERWRLRSPSVHRFFIETEHPDILVDHDEVLRRFESVSNGSVSGLAVLNGSIGLDADVDRQSGRLCA